MTDASTNDTVLVYGATGVQGGAVCNRLLNEGHAVRAQTSNAENTEVLENRGAEASIATLDDPDALYSATEGVSKVVLTLPQGYSSELVRLFGQNAIDAAEEVDVDLLVFNTSTRIPDQETDVAAFEDKRVLEEYLEESTIPFVALRPTLYMENFALPQGAQELVENGIVAYPTPPELRASWISADDLGAFAVETLNHPDWAGQRLDIGGPDVLDGAAIAEHFSAAFDRSVEYQQVPIDAFEAQLTEMMGSEAGKMIPEMYRWAETHLGNGLFETDLTEFDRAFQDIEWTALQTWVDRQNWESLANSA